MGGEEDTERTMWGTVRGCESTDVHRVFYIQSEYVFYNQQSFTKQYVRFTAFNHNLNFTM